VSQDGLTDSVAQHDTKLCSPGFTEGFRTDIGNVTVNRIAASDWGSAPVTGLIESKRGGGGWRRGTAGSGNVGPREDFFLKVIVGRTFLTGSVEAGPSSRP